MSKNDNNTIIRSKKRRILCILAVAIPILLFLVLIETTAIGGNVRFYSHWVRCGSKPFAAVEGLPFNMGTRVRYYYEPDAIEPIRFSYPEYFCTAQEAEDAGYSSNPERYEFRYRGKD